jgi:RNA-directed DNA polymerase
MYIEFPHIIEEKPTSWQLQEHGRRFIEASTLPALIDFLKIKEKTLEKMLAECKYTQFYIPKPKGEKRLIETPEQSLKSLQGQLNKHFQAAYHTVRPACAYGALVATADETAPRNIYTNAMQHIGKKWLLNVDIRRFFPSISADMVHQALKNPPFAFDDMATASLTQLTTFEKRLPTGAPTSPILSNIVCLSLDAQLEAIAREYEWTYTRFIDDLSFSSYQPFDTAQVEAIEKTMAAEKFAINNKKLTIRKIKDKPEVTGLVLKKKKPDISERFIRDLQQNILWYHAMSEEKMIMRQIFTAQLVNRFRRLLQGQLEFVKFVRGEGDSDYARLHKLLCPRGY